MRIKSSAEILFYAKKVSIEKNVHLSPKMCAFFVALIRLFVDKAKYDDEKKMYYVQYSCHDFCQILTQYSHNLISTSLQKFHDCGLVERVPVKREFRKLKAEDGAFLVNMPYLTYLDLSLYIEE